MSTSPPLHHPVPQHPIQFQSNDPGLSIYDRVAPMKGGAIYGGLVGPSVAQTNQFHGARAGSEIPFLNDTTTQLGLEVGRNAISYGQEYIGRNMEKYVSVGALRYYFQVSNSYVLKKVVLVVFPWRHKQWSRHVQRSGSGIIDGFAFPRDDVNAPDMYIPIMGFTSYMILVSVIRGIRGNFHPELLGLVGSKSLALLILELVFVKTCTYFLSAPSSLLDFVAYSGYKFIGVILTTLVANLFGGWLKWITFVYIATATSFFMLRSLRYIILPESSTLTVTLSPGQKQRRIQYLFTHAFICQFLIMWLLL